MSLDAVIALHPRLDSEKAVRVALASLATAIDALENLAAAPMVNGQILEALDKAEMRLALLRARLRMKKSTVHLCSQFGRSVP